MTDERSGIHSRAASGGSGGRAASAPRLNDDDLAGRLAGNLRQLRESRGLTQEQIAKLAGLPRATWGYLESGEANPTLSVLHRAALALQVPLEELTSSPRASGRLYRRDSLPTRKQGDVLLRKLLPDRIPGVLIDRMELPPRGPMTGVPHMPGTREYLTCETGEVVLAVGGEECRISARDLKAHPRAQP